PMLWTKELIKGKILYKLARKEKYEESHTAVENLSKGFPKHLAGKAKEAIEELIKENIILSKPTNYGLQVSINVDKNEIVELLIEQFQHAKTDPQD
ncbi:hypothetical protein HY489_03780, partial [Candidatus Woesearchaeota archaeon]|nr:hypothetical protein [Candidatus Woesearchaeota archaeon]